MLIEEKEKSMNYIQVLKNCIRNHKESVDLCSQLLGSEDLDSSEKSVIENIKKDCEDGLTIFQALLNDIEEGEIS